MSHAIDTDFIISTEQDLLQLDRVHEFLSQKAYWCKGIPRDVVERAARNSLCFGVYQNLGDTRVFQVGFARVVTDDATFAWICDVYIDGFARGRGLSKKLMKAVMEHPRLQGLRRVCLATHDAHELYKKFGFTVTKTPENWLEIKHDKIYLGV